MAVSVYQKEAAAPHGAGDLDREGAALSSEEALFADLANVVLPDHLATRTPVKKALLHVPVRRPDRQWFVRVHPSEEYRRDVALIDLKDEGETYLVLPHLCADLPEVVFKKLYTAISRQGAIFLWPVKLPDEDSRLDAWNTVAHEAAEMAMQKWVRLAANRAVGTYDVFEAQGNLTDPEWPDVPFNKLLELAFRGKVVRDFEHPIVQQLRGQV